MIFLSELTARMLKPSSPIKYVSTHDAFCELPVLPHFIFLWSLHLLIVDYILYVAVFLSEAFYIAVGTR